MRLVRSVKVLNLNDNLHRQNKTWMWCKGEADQPLTWWGARLLEWRKGESEQGSEPRSCMYLDDVSIMLSPTDHGITYWNVFQSLKRCFQRLAFSETSFESNFQRVWRRIWDWFWVADLQPCCRLQSVSSLQCLQIGQVISDMAFTCSAAALQPAWASEMSESE